VLTKSSPSISSHYAQLPGRLGAPSAQTPRIYPGRPRPPWPVGSGPLNRRPYGVPCWIAPRPSAPARRSSTPRTWAASGCSVNSVDTESTLQGGLVATPTGPTCLRANCLNNSAVRKFAQGVHPGDFRPVAGPRTSSAGFQPKPDRRSKAPASVCCGVAASLGRVRFARFHPAQQHPRAAAHPRRRPANHRPGRDGDRLEPDTPTGWSPTDERPATVRGPEPLSGPASRVLPGSGLTSMTVARLRKGRFAPDADFIRGTRPLLPRCTICPCSRRQGGLIRQPRQFVRVTGVPHA